MIDRRSLCLGLAGFSLGPSSSAFAQAANMSRPSAHQFSFDGITGTPIPLSDFKGQVILVVNTACQCGYTPQFGALQRLWSRFRARGFTIIGVPSNDFAGQEPGSEAEIAAFVETQYGVSFPMAAKQVVTGAAAHPFYRWAARERPGDTPRWNFHKYLIGRDGHIAAVYPTSVTPEDPRMLLAIEGALAAKV